jgi:hypothetical protein
MYQLCSRFLPPSGSPSVAKSLCFFNPENPWIGRANRAEKTLNRQVRRPADLFIHVASALRCQ